MDATFYVEDIDMVFALFHSYLPVSVQIETSHIPCGGVSVHENVQIHRGLERKLAHRTWYT